MKALQIGQRWLAIFDKQCPYDCRLVIEVVQLYEFSIQTIIVQVIESKDYLDVVGYVRSYSPASFENDGENNWKLKLLPGQDKQQKDD